MSRQGESGSDGPGSFTWSAARGGGGGLSTEPREQPPVQVLLNQMGQDAREG